MTIPATIKYKEYELHAYTQKDSINLAMQYGKDIVDGTVKENEL